MAGRAVWRLRKRHVAIHPRVAGDSDRDTWRFSQGYLAIGIAACGDSGKGIWRLGSRDVAIQARVFGDWDRDTWRFRQGYLAIGIAACGDSPEGGGDCRGDRWRLPWRSLAIAVAIVGDCRGDRWRLPSAHASPVVASLSEIPCNGPMRLALGGRSCEGKDADEERQENSPRVAG